MRLSGNIRSFARSSALPIIAAMTAVLMASIACGPNPRIMNAAAETPEPVSQPVRSAYETDIEAMRTADFNFIYIFRRKDGAAMTAEDRSFVIANTPVETNRRKVSDEERAIILGSNFRFPPETIAKLAERFAFEDLSKPESELQKLAANANANANSNSNTNSNSKD